MADNLRLYGSEPFATAVLHGGPGAPGGMAPVARRLGHARGVLEPLQSATSVEGQVEELRSLLERHASVPATLVGWSWGALLGFIFAARHPGLVRKLILVGSPPFEAEYARGILATRLGRLGDEGQEAESLLVALEGGDEDIETLRRLGRLFSRTDAFDPVSVETEVDVQPQVFRLVWGEAESMRSSGELLELGGRSAVPWLPSTATTTRTRPRVFASRSPGCSPSSGSCCSSVAVTCRGSNARRRSRSSSCWSTNS